MISKTAEYALRAVVSLASEPNKTLPADALSKTTQIPRRYLHRVLQDLAAAKIVVSRSGPGGGYSLVALAAELTILDVVNAVDPLERITTCPLGIPSHEKLCPLHAQLDCAYAGIETSLRKVTIEKLLRSTHPSPPLCSTLGPPRPTLWADEIGNE